MKDCNHFLYNSVTQIFFRYIMHKVPDLFCRWESARIPKVTVVKVNKIKEQSPYMPQIPDIARCPENLLPLKQWEDSFLADFSELRLVNFVNPPSLLHFTLLYVCKYPFPPYYGSTCMFSSLEYYWGCKWAEPSQSLNVYNIVRLEFQ